MHSRNSLVWFARGFIGMALIILVVEPMVFPEAGWPQAIADILHQARAGQQSLNPTTDRLAVRLDLPDPDIITTPKPGTESQPAPGSDTGPQAVIGDYNSPMIIPAAEFSSDGANPDHTFFSFPDGFVRGTGAGSGCLKAPVYLPDGAVVDYFYGYIVDNESAYTVTVTLERVLAQTGAHDLMASITTSEVSPEIKYLRAPSISPNTISDLFAYYATTCLYTENTKLYAVRIYYHMP